MDQHVERRRAVAGRSADPVQHHHVAVLRDGGVGQDLLEDVLAQRQHAAHQDRRRADHQQPGQHHVAAGQQRVHPADDEHAGRDHRGRVQVGRHRGRRGHRPGQPEMQRHLRALRQRRHGQQRRRDRRGRARPDPRHQLRDGERAVRRVQQHGADQHGHGTDDGDQEGHERGGAGLATVPVEADEEVRADGRHVEEDEQQDEVLRRGQPHHRQREQCHPGPEPPPLRRRPVLVLQVQRQVAGRVREDQRTDAGCQQRVERAETVEGEGQPQPQRRCPRQRDGPASRQPADQEAEERAARRGACRPPQPIRRKGGWPGVLRRLGRGTRRPDHEEPLLDETEQPATYRLPMGYAAGHPRRAHRGRRTGTGRPEPGPQGTMCR